MPFRGERWAAERSRGHYKNVHFTPTHLHRNVKMGHSDAKCENRVTGRVTATRCGRLSNCACCRLAIPTVIADDALLFFGCEEGSAVM